MEVTYQVDVDFMLKWGPIHTWQVKSVYKEEKCFNKSKILREIRVTKFQR